MMDRHFFPNAPPQTFIQTNDPYSSSALLTSMSNDAFALRELIGKLGATCSYDSGPHLQPAPILPHATDPGFAERAAKFSCFGSKSFNERRPPTTTPPLIGHNRSGSSKLPRVSSTPVLKVGVENKFTKFSGSAPANSNDEVELESSVSEQISNEMVSSRKRKGKSKQDDGEDEDVNAKRTKLTAQSGKNGNSGAKMEDEPKPADPPKDYIHVRARRGQATDSHSLAERIRREKISERMKLLQDLVPGCNKVTGKALMLDEIINYVQSLQRQVEFLSMKLASVNPELEADHFNMDNLLTKDMLQQNGNVSQEMYPLDSSMYNHNHHQSHQNVQQHQLHTSTGPILDHVVPLDAPLCRNLGIHMPSIDGFSAAGLPEFPAFGEDDLQSIVQMGFVQNPINFPVAYQTSNMKVEL